MTNHLHSSLVRRAILLSGILIIFAILGVMGELLAAALTGRDRRTYDVLSPDATITQDNQKFDLAAYAARYAPTIRVNPAHLPPEVDTIWYQAVTHEDTITLVYYVAWENEIHPHPVIHRLYEAYRWAVYGSVHDIEYLELQIDRETGIIQRVRFETAADGDYNRQWTTHLYAYLNLNAAQDGYVYCILDREGPCLSDYTRVEGVWDANHSPVLGVMTWNHLFTLIPDADYGAYTQEIQAALHYLTDDTFQQEKLARRSQGDLKVIPDNTMRNVLRATLWSLSAVMAALLALKGLKA